MASISVDEAKGYAQEFLKYQLAIARGISEAEFNRLPRIVGENSAMFLWDDNTPVYEFPLFNTDAGSSMGYIIVSSNTILPPVLEFTFEGEPLSRNLNLYMQLLDELLAKKVKIANYYYLSPLEIAARLEEIDSDGKAIVVNIPTFEPALLSQKEVIERSPDDFMDSVDVEAHWNELLNWEQYVDASTWKILHWKKPKRYQQRCKSKKLEDALGFELGRSGHYCSPNCIAGCVPVAWAMLTSSWKQSSLDNAKNRIWPRSKCWMKEWPSDYKKHTCTVVDNTIWKFGKEIKTSCDGSTSDKQTQHGGRVYKKSWGLKWHFRSTTKNDFSFAKKLIDKGQTFLYTGTGYWSSLFLKEQDIDKPQKAGHGVVAYGYHTGNSYLLVALGWGTYKNNKWIVMSKFGKTRMVYLRSIENLEEPSDEIVQDINVLDTGD